MKRNLMLAYGTLNYLMFLGVFLYLGAFLMNFAVPKSVDSGEAGSLVGSLLINATLISLFGLQHSIMARPGFKRIWTKIVPKPIERSTYVLMSNIVLILLFWQWRPMPEVIWNFDNHVVWSFLNALFIVGAFIVPAVTLLINHFDLFGLRQVWLNYRGNAYTRLHFTTPGPYKSVRHPLYLGWIIMFWSTPTMTVGHLLFALMMTGYILVAIRYEERDLLKEFGRAYEEYQKRTPMLIPRLQLAEEDEQLVVGEA